MQIMSVLKKMSYDDFLADYAILTGNNPPNSQVSKKTLLNKLIEKYSEENFLFELCTSRELNYLQKVLNGDDDVFKGSYSWEIDTLISKYLLMGDGVITIGVPEEFHDIVVDALSKVDFDKQKKRDEVFEYMVGYLKVLGTASMFSLVKRLDEVFGMDENEVRKFLLFHPGFRSYVMMIDDNSVRPKFVYRDYFSWHEEIDCLREEYNVAHIYQPSVDSMRSIFYYDFDLTNPKVKNFYDMFSQDDSVMFLEKIRIHVMLYGNTENIVEFFQTSYFLSKLEKKKKEALIEGIAHMPSGVLNGLTSFEYENSDTVEENYMACLSKADVEKFYVLYFSLLQFVNAEYQVHPDLNIVYGESATPSLVADVINKLWSNADVIIQKYLQKNPDHFSKHQLDIIKKFKKGFRKKVYIVEFSKDFTGILVDDNHAYMIKGLFDPLQRIVNVQLPVACTMTILPFMGQLIYDGSIFLSTQDSTPEEIMKKYQKAKKHYQ